MAGIFLSHATEDKPFVYRLALDLAARGYPIWFDQWNIRVGHFLREAIEGGVGDSEYFILILSENTERSSFWVPEELDLALALEEEQGRTIILPVRIDDAPVPEKVADRLYADFSSSYHVGLAALTKEFQSLRLDEADVPMARRTFPCIARDGTYLNRQALRTSVAAARTNRRQGETMSRSQLRQSPEDAYLQQRVNMQRRMDETLSPDVEDAVQHIDTRLVHYEQTLDQGLELIINNIGLEDSSLEVGDAAHWYCRLCRTSMMWLVSATNTWLEGLGDQPNPYWSGLDMLSDVYGISQFDRVDIGPRRPTEMQMYVGFPLRTDPDLGLKAVVDSWQEKYHALGNQEPVYQYLSWHELAKWVLPQLMYRHLVLEDVTLPLTWNFDYWMMGAH